MALIFIEVILTLPDEPNDNRMRKVELTLRQMQLTQKHVSDMATANENDISW